jgi:hypothetical protein
MQNLNSARAKVERLASTVSPKCRRNHAICKFSHQHGDDAPERCVWGARLRYMRIVWKFRPE